MRRSSRSKRSCERREANGHGFTLVELLVVIAIIGVLVALLLPAVQAAREAARRSQCKNNLRQIGLAVLNFEQNEGRLPAGSTTRSGNNSGPYLSTWSVDILPFLEKQNVYDLWDQESGFSRYANLAFRQTLVDVYQCPSDINLNELGRPETGPGRKSDWAPGSYRAMSGHSLGVKKEHYWDAQTTGFPGNKEAMPLEWRGAMYAVSPVSSAVVRKIYPVKLQQISDGTSNTFLVGEYQTTTFQARRTFWAYAYTSYNQSSAFFESRTLLPDYLKCLQIGGGGFNTCKRAWGSLHSGGAVQFVFCDGSVHSISPDVDMGLFVATATIQNGEVQTLAGN